jgi:probable rRNA maturation factor
MPVSIDPQHPLADAELGELTRVLSAAIQAELGVVCDLSVVLCDDATIAELNEQYLGHPGPTDVISFPQHALLPGQRPPDSLLGDIVVSVETATRQAAEFADWSLADELALLVIHGLLHLCGWDDLQPQQRKAMQAREDHVLQAVGRRAAPREQP